MAEEKKERKENEFVPLLTKEDKDGMAKHLSLIALRIPSRNIGKLGNLLKPYTFQRKGTKSFQTDSQNIVDPLTNKAQFKCLLLNECFKTIENVSEKLPQKLMKLINECEAKPINYCLVLDYDKLSALEVLKYLITNDSGSAAIEIPTHYESVGHIAHFNLKKELLRYKYLIGQIYLDKLPNSIKTIINKTASISNAFRVFPMEVICGEHTFFTNVKENGCKFAFDFSKIYWNSRLGTEHERICNLFKQNETICDMMAGVGPFAIPSAKYKQCTVYANDLNPNSFKYLKQNCELNNVAEYVHCYNLDGREFWKMLRENKQFVEIDHIIMNLPAIALEFLNVFRNCYSLNEIETYGLPMIHCYCFARDVEPTKSIHERLRKHLGVIPKESNLKLRLVRNIAPHNDMYCVSFRLPKEVALCNNPNKHKLSDDPPLKRRKLNE